MNSSAAHFLETDCWPDEATGGNQRTRRTDLSRPSMIGVQGKTARKGLERPSYGETIYAPCLSSQPDQSKAYWFREDHRVLGLESVPRI